MSENAMTEEFDLIELFDKPALFSNFRIDRSTVPDGWYCYDIRGSEDDPGRPWTLERKVVVNHAGTILSPEEIPFSEGKNYRYISGKINFLGGSTTISGFCEQYKSPVPAPAIIPPESHKKNRSHAHER